MGFEISFTNGRQPIPFNTLDEAESWVSEEYPEGTYGHDGDLRDPTMRGDPSARTLFWSTEKDAENDDGAKAAGEIRRIQ